MLPYDLLASIVKIQGPHVLVDVLAHEGVSASFKPHDDAMSFAIFDNVVHGEVEVQEHGDEFWSCVWYSVLFMGARLSVDGRMCRMQPGERCEMMLSTSMLLKAATTARAVCF